MKILLVGGGRISLSHIPQILARKDVEVVDIVEPSFYSRLILKQLFKTSTYKSIERIKKFDKYDAAFVLTPTGSHYEICKNLLHKGLNVFIEKPFTLSYLKSSELIEIARKKQLSLQVGYVLTHNPVILFYKDLIYKEIIEKKKFNLSINMYGNVVNSKSSGWRFKGPFSGCLKDYGSHILTLADFLIGPIEMKKVNDSGSKFLNSSLDYLNCSFKPKNFPNDLINIEIDWAREEFRKATIICNFKTEDTEIIYDQNAITIFHKGLERKIALSDIPTECTYYLRGEEFSNQLDYFFQDMRKEKKCYELALMAARTDKYINDIEFKI